MCSFLSWLLAYASRAVSNWMAGDIKFLLWLLLLSSSSSCFGNQDDVHCLKTVLETVVNSYGILKSSWVFDNTTYGYGTICRFFGVECRNPDSVFSAYSLRLSNLGLCGQFPQGFEYCTYMTGLDLSNNKFSGPIPSDIAKRLQYVTALNLSYNSFSGEIPVGISDLSYLINLNVQHNQLSGQIPRQFSSLLWLTSVNIADNLLSGPIPSVFQNYPASNFTGNLELYGAPLDSSSSTGIDESKIRNIGAAVGFVLGFVVAFYFPHCFVCSWRFHPYIVRIC